MFHFKISLKFNNSDLFFILLLLFILIKMSTQEVSNNTKEESVIVKEEKFNNNLVEKNIVLVDQIQNDNKDIIIQPLDFSNVYSKNDTYTTVKINVEDYMRIFVEGTLQSIDVKHLSYIMKFHNAKFLKNNYNDIKNYTVFANYASGIIQCVALEYIKKNLKPEDDYVVTPKYPMKNPTFLRVLGYFAVNNDNYKCLLKKVQFEVLMREITIKKVITHEGDKEIINYIIYPVFELNSDFIVVDDPYELYMINGKGFPIKIDEAKKRALEDRMIRPIEVKKTKKEEVNKNDEEEKDE